ncbi:MAG: UDP-glucose--hexose-1-phosphate uridylyltransferase [Clostridia bacterium]|nr:UDP-glucose--hexose-1-phosphate uridylyltransferase [Clostridia bacterium]
MIEKSVRKLVCYGMEKGLFDKRDEVYVTNRIIEVLGLDSISCDEDFSDVNLEETLSKILDFAVEKGLIDKNITARDLFDTKLMGLMLPPPSVITDKFFEEYKTSPEAATEYYYNLSRNSDYIRTYRVKKDMKWVTETKYGDMDITINLSKPEKSAKDIEAAKNAPQSDYPKCLLCKECEGYAGRMNFPARQNHRVIPVKLNGEDWFFQYSPYVYYNEHCIVFDGRHIPMEINISTFRKLFDFVKMFPHYFLGSNAGLPVVGGSILSHSHYQGGNYTFAMAKAPVEKEFAFEGFSDVNVGLVKWPMSVIRLTGKDVDRVIALGDKILTAWKEYTDESVGVFAYTDNEPHNTVTPIARKAGEDYQLDIVLRNNIRTKEYPLGVFHPHEELHNIKKENIGLIEVMGLAVLPARLKTELKALGEKLVSGDAITEEELLKHKIWAEQIKEKYTDINKDNIDEIIKREVGLVFERVLEDAGVFKRDQKGQDAFVRFMESVK